MPDNRYTITIQLPKDGELDAAISKVIEERLLVSQYKKPSSYTELLIG